MFLALVSQLELMDNRLNVMEDQSNFLLMVCVLFCFFPEKGRSTQLPDAHTAQEGVCSTGQL